MARRIIDMLHIAIDYFFPQRVSRIISINRGGPVRLDGRNQSTVCTTPNSKIGLR